MNKISVIIPNYNRANDLIKAIKSVLNQSYPVHEVLVCDDGSTDNAKQLVDDLNDDRVQWIDCGRNGMPSIPRNIGIAKSSGEWLAFLDNDDTWLPNKLEIQMQLLEKSNLLASSTNAFKIDKDNNSLGKYHKSDLPNVLSLERIFPANWIICSSAIIHRSLLEKAVGFPESVSLRALEDYALWLRIASLTSFSYTDEALVNYKDAPSQSIRSKDDGKWQQRERIFDDYYRWCISSGMNDEKIKNAKRAVRQAMKYNGKGFLERFRYK